MCLTYGVTLQRGWEIHDRSSGVGGGEEGICTYCKIYSKVNSDVEIP